MGLTLLTVVLLVVFAVALAVFAVLVTYGSYRANGPVLGWLVSHQLWSWVFEVLAVVFQTIVGLLSARSARS